MHEFSRREFARQSLGGLLTFSLLETLLGHDLLADEVKPVTAQWLRDVNQLGLDLKGQKLKQTDWQTKVEELFKRVPLADVLKLIDFDRISQGVKFVDQGALSMHFQFPEVEGVPKKLVFGKQIFALKKDRSVVPHGHNNMATAFLILKGDLHGRHYDRLKDEPEPHHHQAHDRPQVHCRRVLDDLGLQGQRALVPGDHRAGVHLQPARDGHPARQHRAHRPAVPGPQRREAGRRLDPRRTDQLRRGEQAVRVSEIADWGFRIECS